MNSSQGAVEDNVLKELQQIAVDRALQTRDVGDVERAVNIIKAVTDRERTARDNRNARSLMKNEWLKTGALAVVPFLTLATLGFTVWIQSQQLQQSNIANEDLGWRDTAQKALGRLSGPTTADTALAIQVLRPYFSDSRHSTDAIDLAMFVASRIPDERVAGALFASPQIAVTEDNIGVFLNRAREVSTDIDILRDRNGLARQIPEALRPQAVAALNANLRLISEKIASALRSGKIGTSALDLRNAYLLDSNLTGLDFSTALVAGATFAASDLTDADLSHLSASSDTSWPGANWWDAKAIEGHLLARLWATSYPYETGDAQYLVQPPSRTEYRKKVLSLCKAAGINCAESDLQYGPKPDPSVAAVVDRLSPTAAMTIAGNNYADMTVKFNTLDAAHEMDDLITAGLCTRLTQAELRAAEKAEDLTRGAYVAGMSCGLEYGNVHRFLIDVVRPELTDLTHRSQTSRHDAGLVAATPVDVLQTLFSFSNAALAFILENESGEVDYTGLPDASDQDAIAELVAAQVCTKDTSTAPLATPASKSIQQKDKTVLKVTCGPTASVVRKLVLEGVVPAYIADLKEHVI